jgi:hypothetical protein
VGKTNNGVAAASWDKHILYEAAVQSVDADQIFMERLFRRRRGRAPRTFREDFCGTAALSCEFVRRHPGNRAWGVDLHRPTLDWGRRHNLSLLGPESGRVTLLHRNVLHVRKPPVDMVAALNFSYGVFHTREELARYFRTAYESLNDEGVFVLDAYGGTESIDVLTEKRPIPASRRPDGTRVPAFTYVWEQASFNPVDHHTVCHIHFRFRDGSRRQRAFTYDWRLWTLPEMTDLLRETGFRDPEIYVEGWDDIADESDGVFRLRRRYDQMAGWIAYVVGYR